MDPLNLELPRVPGAVLLRRAVPKDARAISRLYDRAYTTDEGEARDQYPFPQILEPDWVAEAVAGGSIAWVVAESEGALVASAAALRNIGGRRDRIGEVFGIVVANEARRRGIATRLLDFLCGELGGEADVVLCEARTAEPGGWKTSRNCGFLPVGFEPLAHAMPVGFEPMVLTAKVTGDVLFPPAVPPRLTPSAEALATAVTQGIARRRPAGAEALTPGRAGDAPAEPIDVRRDDEEGRRALERWGDDLDHGSGVICLRPLEGEDREHRRYERPYFLGHRGGRAVGCARAVWDRTDRRARILDLRVERDAYRAGMLAGTIHELLRMADDAPLVLVVNVRADADDLQHILERLRFFPTTYYPGLIAAEGGRCDALQFTRLYRCRIEQGLDFVSDIDWPGARLVVDQVLTQSNSACRSEHGRP